MTFTVGCPHCAARVPLAPHCTKCGTSLAGSTEETVPRRRKAPAIVVSIIRVPLLVALLFMVLGTVFIVLPTKTAMSLGKLVLVTGLFALYFLPSMIAVHRGHRNGMAIGVVNLFLGWTFLGWVVTLAWACTNNTTREAS